MLRVFSFGMARFACLGVGVFAHKIAHDRKDRFAPFPTIENAVVPNGDLEVGLLHVLA